MPYNPVAQYNGAEYLGQGISSGASNLGQGIESWIQKSKQEKDQAKAYDAVVKANPKMLDELGLSQDQWDASGRKDKLGAFSGYFQMQAIQNQKLGAQKAVAALRYQQAQLEHLRQADQEDAAVGNAEKAWGAENFAPGPTDVPNPAGYGAGGMMPPDAGGAAPPPMSRAQQVLNTPMPNGPPPGNGLQMGTEGTWWSPEGQKLQKTARDYLGLPQVGNGNDGNDRTNVALAALAATSTATTPFTKERVSQILNDPRFKLGGRAGTKFMQLIQGHNAAVGDGTPTIFEDPVTGDRKVILNKTMMTSGVNPEKQPKLELVEQMDAQGNPTGLYAYRTKNGMGVKAKPQDATARNQKMSVESLAAANHALIALQGAIDDWQSRQARSKNPDSKVTAPDPTELQDLEERRDEMKAAMKLNRTGATPPPAATDTGAAPAKASAGDEEASRKAAAAAIKRFPGNRPAILKRMRDAGFSVDGL